MAKKIILYLFRLYFSLIANIIIEKNDAIDLKPPYLVLGNHSSNFDPFLIAAYLKKPVDFVASDEYFRKKTTGYLIRLAGAIPKTKFKIDFSTIKKIIKKKNEGKIIGVFPEGKRNWDGQTEEIIYSTAKLIKLLKIPVVNITIRGAHLFHPRWAIYNRRGTISLSIQKILTPDQISNMSVEQIYEFTRKEFSYDEYSYQIKIMNKYRGKRLAENLELFLFICPKCKSIGKMKSKGDTFFCSQCGYMTKYNQLGFFETDNKLYFANPKEWNRWQLKYLREILSKEELLMQDGEFVILKITKGKLKKTGQGKLVLKNNNLIFLDNSGEEKIFYINNISGLNIQYNNKLEFYYQDILYRIIPADKTISAYKWQKTIELIKLRGVK